MGEGQVVFQHLVEEQRRFLEHRRLEDVVILGVERAVGQGGINGSETEPLAGEVGVEGLGLGIAEQALDLLTKRLGFMQFVRGGEFEERLIRH